MKQLYGYLIGSTKYCSETSNPSIIAGRLMSEYIGSVYNVRVTGRYSFVFSCFDPMCRKVLAFLGEKGCSVTEMSRTGLAYHIKKALRKTGLLFGILLAIVTVYIRSGTVWDITVSGNHRVSDREIENILEKAGLGIGKPYKTEELSSICNRFILLDDRFSWISVNMSGNAAFVEVMERVKKEDLTGYPSNSGIIADKDCVIERPEVVRGTALVKKGDTVSGGAMIISPVESGLGENEYISGAMGKVYARTYEDFVVIVPYNCTGRAYSGTKVNSHSISFLGLEFDIKAPFVQNPENYSCITLHTRPGLSEDIVFPIRDEVTRRYAYNIEECILDKGEAKEKAYDTMYSDISCKIKDGEILSTSFTEEESENCFILRCRVECIRNIAKVCE